MKLLTRDPLLCEFVNRRLGQLTERKVLDDHTGFNSLAGFYFVAGYQELGEALVQG